MDELTFHNELHQLKQQIANMAMKHGHSLSPTLQYCAPHDQFPHQLHELKAQLAKLDTTLANVYRVHHAYRAADAPSYQRMQLSNRDGPPTPSPLHTPQEQPPNALIMQSLAALHADVLGFDRRVARVENTLSSLEGNLEQLNASRFTPPSSISSYGNAAASLRHSHIDSCVVTEDKDYALTASPTPDEDRTATSFSHARLPGVRSLLASPGSKPKSIQMKSDRDDASMRQSRAEFANATLTMLHRYNDSVQGNCTRLDKHNAQLARTILRLNAKLHGINDNPKADDDPEIMCHFQHPKLQDAPGGVSQYGHRSDYGAEPVSNEAASSAELDAGLSHGPVQLSCHATMGGAAFRDQEIMRLDELLRTAQEDLAASEQRAVMHRVELSGAQSLHLRREAALQAELLYVVENGEKRNIPSELQARDQEIQSLRDTCRQHWKDSVRFQREAEACEERMGRQSRDNIASREEMDQRLRERSVEVRDLEVFCDRNEAITREQEDVIARGARLLAERDNEISSLTLRLEAVENGRQRQKTATAVGDESRNRSTVVDEPGARWQQGSEARTWPPQPVRGERRLSNEARRAYVWDGIERSPRPDIRQPGPTKPRKSRRGNESEQGRAVTYVDGFDDEPIPSTKPERREQALPGLRDSEPHSVPSHHLTREDDARHRSDAHGHLTDRTLMPPLPVPLPVPRMHTTQSIADVRSAFRRTPPPGMRKHQSMHELPRRGLQAYVETEESDGGIDK